MSGGSRTRINLSSLHRSTVVVSSPRLAFPFAIYCHKNFRCSDSTNDFSHVFVNGPWNVSRVLYKGFYLCPFSLTGADIYVLGLCGGGPWPRPGADDGRPHVHGLHHRIGDVGTMATIPATTRRTRPRPPPGWMENPVDNITAPTLWSITTQTRPRSISSVVINRTRRPVPPSPAMFVRYIAQGSSLLPLTDLLKPVWQL